MLGMRPTGGKVCRRPGLERTSGGGTFAANTISGCAALGNGLGRESPAGRVLGMWQVGENEWGRPGL
jgi:hypothetical protein